MCGEPNDNATPLSGWPFESDSRKMSDQATVNPQLADLRGDIATSFAASVSTHPPVGTPSRGQLAARRAPARSARAASTLNIP